MPTLSNRSDVQSACRPRWSGVTGRRAADRSAGAPSVPTSRSPQVTVARGLARGRDPSVATPDRRRQSLVEGVQRSRRSIAWSSSPTGRTCRCRSPACGSSRRAPSWASPPAGSFPRCRRSSPAPRRSGSARTSPTSPISRSVTSATTSWASTRPGSWTSGASTGAASRRRPPACSRSVADYDSALVSLTAEVARTYVAIRTFEVLIEQARGQRQDPGGGAGDRPVSLPQRRDLGARSDAGDDAAGEHARHDPAAADRAAAGAQRA